MTFATIQDKVFNISYTTTAKPFPKFYENAVMTFCKILLL